MWVWMQVCGCGCRGVGVRVPWRAGEDQRSTYRS